jgi:ABC-type transport system substrate-binding protein
LLQQAGKILMADVPFVPLYNLASIYGATKNLSWKMRPDEKVLGWDMNIK